METKGKVDVLDVMDSDADKAYEFRRSKGSAGAQHANMRSRLSGEARAAVAELITASRVAEAALADIGDADRVPGDDIDWAERRAGEALPAIRAALSALRSSQGGREGDEGEGRELT